MSRRRRITVMATAVVVIVSTPAFWLLDGPDTGQLVGASLQTATGVCALIWAWIQPTGSPAVGSRDVVVATGRAEASGGGRAHTGIRRRQGGGGGEARVQHSGEATARGQGSSAGTGIDYTN
ncbi:hypothetical protein OG539_43385 [Actinacidiphila glaucinigra]